MASWASWAFFALVGVLPRNGGQIRLAEGLQNGVARCGNGFAGHLNAVGPHIGDEADRLAADVDPS